ncbi:MULTISPECIES: DUF2975 domain-containing protein [unclassified Arthrobacter]|uniref:DUF2975 domain-containing protein n=1 Tax=unclassified Arthrobacter TaxID=235627 RepID=UPI001E463355|nr:MULTISPECIES: DUF2975 domain-containing protein [unclassified Arthrobacter]MCC9144354.1 DUF2975 domain-containing protein [Arthrobacter sp. zg-Y919]MDK1275580.1 DUF2975 domain-containing protein [Arthrobacter sp. zg.Y919]WIB03049.1 DUF2975 domain-containing protein [Arthrobacter sp. zg-Y919]
MGKATILVLRSVLALVLLGTLFVQAVMVPLFGIDLAEAGAEAVRIPVLSIVVLGILAFQVCLVCVWRLLTMVRRGTVFSSAAFRYVDVIIGALSAAALLLFALGTVLAPGEEVAPGIVLLISGMGITIAAGALLVLVMRALLASAVATAAEAARLRTELGGVI